MSMVYSCFRTNCPYFSGCPGECLTCCRAEVVRAVLALPKKRSGPQNLLAPFRCLAILAIIFLASFASVLRAQSPLSLGGNGDAVFKDAAGNFADNVGQFLTTAGTARQIQLDARFTF